LLCFVQFGLSCSHGQSKYREPRKLSIDLCFFVSAASVACAHLVCRARLRGRVGAADG
jgi:hypothetical protein